MFESVTRDPGAEGLEKASRIFYIISVLIGLSMAIDVIVGISSGRGVRPISIVINVVLAIVAFLTGNGINQQKTWAKWSGIVLGIVELINVPIGTIIGIA